MADLSARPSLDHLRRQARDLLRAARAGDRTAAGRIRAVADALTLASAQLRVRLRQPDPAQVKVTARTASLARRGSILRGPASVTARAGRPGCWRPPKGSPATASPPR